MKIVFRKSAEKELLNLQKSLRERIFKKIGLLTNNPLAHESKKLAGEEGYRIRIGSYRVIYLIDKASQTITIIKIAHRREVYR